MSALCVAAVFNPLNAKGHQGIATYYIRYDEHSFKHQITGGRLTMIPAERDYRAENFSRIRVAGKITADNRESNHTLENMAKKNAFIKILELNGLKSVTTKGLDTTITYEALVLSPIDLQIGPYERNIGGYAYTAQINFAPMAFPDQWNDLRLKFKIKEIFNDFILLFK
ncbi:MAG: hypothetical protein HUN04_03985 [Desulfobacter sp.]|nr:MAG: hypothetical protein HUN04_03985 [Desulfobacter sp.]